MITYKPHEQLLELRKEHSEFFDEWATFLETTDLKQAQGAMSNGEGTACCLQVLEVHKGNIPINWVESDMVSYPTELYSSPTTFGGMKPENTYLAEDSITGEDLNPMVVNDDRGLNFIQIAQLLRGNEVIA